jgi:predicted glycoside hydrolase/deacetylase ChbG (UPF0249 family)
MAGLLIVNADDLGGNSLATDRILGCFAAGTITSATAMVFMADSARAASFARGIGMPVGLHLNLTQPFDDPDVPRDVARRQRRLVDYMAHARRRKFGVAPQLVGTIRAAIADQVERFHELYGSEPTHLDGHNHVHLNPTVLLCLPAGWSVRPAHDPSVNGARAAVWRRGRDLAVTWRHPTVDHFFALAAVHPALGGTGLERALGLAGSESVEIMVHPDDDRTYEVLVQSNWREHLAARRLGSYSDLRLR